MAWPQQEAIDTFIGITGADEAVAVRKLEEHAGDLNQAVNSYFNDGAGTANTIDQPIGPVNLDDMELDGPLDNTFQRSLYPEALHDPFALMDPNFQQMVFDRAGSAGTASHDAQGSHPIEATVDVKDSNVQTGPSGQASIIENVTGHGSLYGPGGRETIIIDDDEDELPYGLSSQHANFPSSASQPNPPLPTAPPLVHVIDNDIEEEMIRAAIEASKREAEELANTAEQERAQHLDGINSEDMETAGATMGRQELVTGMAGASTQLTDGESSQEDTEDVEEEPLVRRRSRRIPSGDTESRQPIVPGDSPPSSSQPQNSDHQYNRTDFPSEWGGISSEEHDEAVMLEAAMFGGIPEAPTYPLSIPSHASSSHYPQVVHSPPPELTEQRLLREQQDDEYLASLQADQEKEMKTLQEAELRQLEETAARESALEKQKQEEEERLKKQLEKEELESSLATKQASLPSEPPSGAEGVITLVVRMPDGSRQGRRFLKSDKFQSLFDFLDVGRTCRPGTYKLVRTYPRRAFTPADGDQSFSELGLTSKQEALFIEQITE
ncbi:plant UBX domain-containing protein 8-like [Lolium rigidum]|uniref:plant UBX domain-containing protein 8-like n=1 Tax=Lolium rigidum TaxID=89674 RepID=UPI001F5C55DE|nr:plant UBX domain-containing protein 8-like [Lolium rigidum]